MAEAGAAHKALYNCRWSLWFFFKKKTVSKHLWYIKRASHFVSIFFSLCSENFCFSSVVVCSSSGCTQISDFFLVECTVQKTSRCSSRSSSMNEQRQMKRYSIGIYRPTLPSYVPDLFRETKKSIRTLHL